jgi:hypothetical protein
LKELLISDDFPVLRIKIEAALWNEDVPQSASEIIVPSPERYFESHIRILFDSKRDNAELIETIRKHSAHLSCNALRRDKDGFEERFITRRVWSGGYSESREQLNALLREMRALNYTVIDVEEEYVVYDSNLEIDAGWIQTNK